MSYYWIVSISLFIWMKEEKDKRRLEVSSYFLLIN